MIRLQGIIFLDFLFSLQSEINNGKANSFELNVLLQGYILNSVNLRISLGVLREGLVFTNMCMLYLRS